MRNEIEVWLLENGFHEKPHCQYGRIVEKVNLEYIVFVKGSRVSFDTRGTANHPIYAGQRHSAGSFKEINCLSDFLFLLKRIMPFECLREVVFTETFPV